MADTIDIAVIGAGAAGLMSGIWAGRTNARRRIVVLDGARKVGVKILVAGGGRCNVTHDHVDERAFAGASPHAIKQVLRAFDVPRTIEFFAQLGVTLKREPTGKLFPTTDRAATVLDALLMALRDAGVELRHPCRVQTVRRIDDAFLIAGDFGELRARHVILASGGRSLPKSGSDGHGYEIARGLGHSITPRILPALVPLMLPPDHFLCALSGITQDATIELRAASGRRLISFTDSTLCTHFGLSGPCVLDISRHYLHARLDDPGAHLVMNWLPRETFESMDQSLLALGQRGPATMLRERIPARLAAALCEQASVDPAAPGRTLTRAERHALARAVTQLQLPVIGDRGFTVAEVTAGGVPLNELRLNAMASRLCPGLHLCGEICDVDGRIGGYNFQWAWSSGYVAGISVGREDNPPA